MWNIKHHCTFCFSLTYQWCQKQNIQQFLTVCSSQLILQLKVHQSCWWTFNICITVDCMRWRHLVRLSWSVPDVFWTVKIYVTLNGNNLWLVSVTLVVLVKVCVVVVTPQRVLWNKIERVEGGGEINGDAVTLQFSICGTIGHHEHGDQPLRSVVLDFCCSFFNWSNVSCFSGGDESGLESLVRSLSLLASL